MLGNKVVDRGLSYCDWDRFAEQQAECSVYHLRGWAEIISRSYSHSVFNLSLGEVPSDRLGLDNGVPQIGGILPLVQIKQWPLGNSLVSMPFCDIGGVVATDPSGEIALIEKALELADEQKSSLLELRQTRALACLTAPGFDKGSKLPFFGGSNDVNGWFIADANPGQKVRMLLTLPNDADLLMRSFKSKLRNQIRKPIKDGLSVKVGGLELVDDFYEVFLANMRDLGSPVHSIRFIYETLTEMATRSRIFVVHKNGVPMASGLTLAFRDTLFNPWASSLKMYSTHAPNMLLYWTMLEYACSEGYQKFDFGRSTVDEGTYRFKQQWGAKPAPLYWYRFFRDSRAAGGLASENWRMRLVIECWKRLPIEITRVLGPRIRKYISL